MESAHAPLLRPRFLAIIASNALAVTMARKANGRVDGFIIEGPTAGGHNAPPRGKLEVNEIDEPVYGDRDIVDLAKMRELGLPFWLAGGFGTPEQLEQALAEGAMGVQIGSAFAYCAESGMREDLKRSVIAQIAYGEATVFTDRLASPTGFPFKVVEVEGTISSRQTYEQRARICDLGYLTETYRVADGSIGFRCPSEPQTVYISKGGDFEETVGRKCICNALMATAGYAQRRGSTREEPGIVTSGNDLSCIRRYLAPGELRYSAADVIAGLLCGVSTQQSVNVSQ
jgi:nitronate monooxygenase